ncbi:MAG: polyphosphate kinase 1 [Acidobacteriota bacterium]|nr:polyphosphate kinase 1 [Acidobacteriota bacterium]
MTDGRTTTTVGERAARVDLPASLRHSRGLLINREVSLVEFFRRVLEEAQDETQPVLERVKFLSILSSNLDEFFMIRVSGIKEELDQEVVSKTVDGLMPDEQLRLIREHVVPLVAEQSRCLAEEVLPQLRARGVEIVPYAELTRDERAQLKKYFDAHVFPVLTPQGVDPSHPFPYISNLSLNIGLMVEPVVEHGITRSLTGLPEPRFVRVKVPPLVPRLVKIGAEGSRFVWAEELIAANIGELFPRMRAGRCHLFRVTRDADIELRDYEADDLLRSMEQTLRKRRFGKAVRLEVSATMPREMVDYLAAELEVDPDDIYTVEGPLGMGDLMQLYSLDRPDLKDEPLRPTVPAVFEDAESVFDVVRARDVLLHHPYTSYSTVIDFMNEAARDPEVVAVKMCLYRTGANSPIPEALIEASARGKQVTALVELKARFDEEANIEWAKRLEQAGVHVVYGVLGLKTHCKVALVVRREGESLRRYVHIATGNYNPVTGGVYTDFGLLTANEEFGEDATDLFNYLTGFSRQKEYLRLMVAPVNLREKMIELINRERDHHLAGRPARIVAKNNRIADVEVIRALYEASQAGVPVDLIVRGICMLRPGVPGLSETIRVRSIVGRLLEHSRAYYFANGGDEEVYTGSADWMARNLDRRIEVIAPVLDPSLRRYLKDVALEAYLRDNVKAREMLSDGTYVRVRPAPGEEPFDSQSYFEGSVSLKA